MSTEEMEKLTGINTQEVTNGLFDTFTDAIMTAADKHTPNENTIIDLAMVACTRVVIHILQQYMSVDAKFARDRSVIVSNAILDSVNIDPGSKN